MKPVFTPTAVVTCAVAALLAVAMSAPAQAQASVTAADFWRAPSINAFAGHLQQSRYQHVDRLANERDATGKQDGDAVAFDGWPHDAQLERMQGWLEKGIVAAEPAASARWSDVQARAHRIGVLEKVDAQHGVDALNTAIGLWPGSTWLEGAQGSATPHAAALVRAIDLPTVQASWLTSGRDIALGRDDAEALSGRFGGVYRMLRVDAPAGTQGKPLFSEESVGVVLTRPLVRTVIYRDGRFDSAATHGHARRMVWGEDASRSPCDHFVAGFALGDADADFHAATGMDAYTRSQSAQMKPVGSVLSIVTRDALPAARAMPAVTMHALDVEATGFASATQLAYDVDTDGVADLVVWEGRGAAVMVEGRDVNTLRHRIFFANVQGEWRVLGSDAAQTVCEQHGC